MMKWMLAAALCGATLGAAAADAPSVTLHGKTYSTEFATDDAQREHGLMDRAHMDADHSMLFIFPSDEPRAFWMKNTLIPLDILYFDQARKLVAMQLNAQPCKADPCAIYPSGNLPARYVLELNAGEAGRLGLNLGDELTVSGTPAPAR
ncbi:uncharacterized membrane protein (UPF0127 family) [Luteibacter sp. 621]|uniref:DUF192 domain-containing protein n=1 Tax=Luteibacter sp. 621 TaxID=3373916 RepID=UPI003D1B0E3C